MTLADRCAFLRTYNLLGVAEKNLNHLDAARAWFTQAETLATANQQPPPDLAEALAQFSAAPGPAGTMGRFLTEVLAGGALPELPPNLPPELHEILAALRASTLRPLSGPPASGSIMANDPRCLRVLFMALCWLGACHPLSAPAPFHMTETTEVLRPDQFSFGLALGGGGLSSEGQGVGGALRLRFGIGSRQELGIEGAAVAYSNRPYHSADPPWIGGGTVMAAKLSWKGAPLPWLALIAGPAVSTTTTGTAAGGDLAVLFSPGRPLGGWVRPYAAARGFFMLPVGRDLDLSGGPTAGLVLPVGLAIEPNRRLRLFIEAGGIGMWSNVGTAAGRWQAATAVTPSGECGTAAGVTYQTGETYPWICGPGQHGGGYALVGMTVIIEHVPDVAAFLKTLRRWE